MRGLVRLSFKNLLRSAHQQKQGTLSHHNLLIQSIRAFSVNDVTSTRINDWLVLKEAKNVEPSERHKRPLAIIYKWLRARPKDVWKYEELYLDRGFDVLTTGIAIKELLYRPSVIKRTDDIIEAVNRPSLSSRKILIHSLSIGGYLVGELRYRLLGNPTRAAEVGERIIAHVSDSFIDYKGGYYGLSRTVFGQSKAALVMEAALNAADEYLGKYPNSFVYAFKEITEVLHKDPIRAPSLLYFSNADLLGAPKWSEEVARDWGKLGMTVHTKGWQDSQHVGHLRKHREEYIHTLDRFLADIGVLPRQFEDGGILAGDAVATIPEKIKSRAV
ncbi:uncharacterized protein LOC141909732 [Tubulanus polymorphus]|uniref:uncharacterized protein LOC141909732 n=1 Tax=Tubulanus polymorphus TaxID=672921 RepID=UPI003DA1F84A